MSDSKEKHVDQGGSQETVMYVETDGIVGGKDGEKGSVVECRDKEERRMWISVS